MRIALVIFFTLPILGSSQVINSGRVFLHWGYNRAAYTVSDIHFQGNGYDFRVLGAKATDRPTQFDVKTYFGGKTLTIPQYVYRVGYFVKENLSVSIGMDHMKYVLQVPSVVRLDGSINPTASKEYAGNYDNEELELLGDFLLFEHSDGLNYLNMELDFYKTFITFSKGELSWSYGPGAGTYIPKTKVMLFNNEIDNKFHIAGFGLSGHTRLALTVWEAVYVNTGVKSGWCFLPDVLIDGSTARANHNFGWIQFYGALGIKLKTQRTKALQILE